MAYLVKYLIVGVWLALVSGAAIGQVTGEAQSSFSAKQKPLTVDQLLAKRGPSAEATMNVPAGRRVALRESGVQYGLRAGLNAGYQKVWDRLEAPESRMDELYPFRSLMLEGNVVPPVVAEVRGVYDQAAPGRLRLADREITLITEPRFAHAPPDWRDYFIHDFSFDPAARPAVAPQNADEQVVWEDAVREGFAMGEADAINAAMEDTRNLDRDFKGMRLYHELLIAGKLTKPYVAVTHVALSGDKNSMKEGETYLTIAVVPEFVHDPASWNVPIPEAIRERVQMIKDPEQGGEMVRRLGVARVNNGNRDIETPAKSKEPRRAQ